MPISRRDFFRHASIIGAAASATTWRLDEPSQASPQGRSGSTRPVDPIRLDTNINPYGPSTRVVEVIRANLELVNQYPDREYGPLVERIADFHRVKPKQITLGSGSRDVLRMAVAAFLPGGKRFVLASPTFEPVANLAKQVGAEVTPVPLNKHYAHDLDAMLHRTNASTRLLYICNPNNPTGSLTPRKDLESFLEKLPSKVVVVIDEAYHEYVGPHSDYASFIDHPIADKRVLVVRTFSKIHGLAGLRLGYAVGSEEASLKLSALQLERGVNIVAARAAVAALDDSDYVGLSSKRNADERQEFYNQTNARMLRQIDSHTNFVFLKFGLPSSQVVEHFERNNITLGPVFPQFEKHVRVAVSTQANMSEFWRVWDLMPMSHEMAMDALT
jgi:histidinol-phosphate aminotransferase